LIFDLLWRVINLKKRTQFSVFSGQKTRVARKSELDRTRFQAEDGKPESEGTHSPPFPLPCDPEMRNKANFCVSGLKMGSERRNKANWAGRDPEPGDG
jgi:hypothetical protein